MIICYPVAYPVGKVTYLSWVKVPVLLLLVLVSTFDAVYLFVDL